MYMMHFTNYIRTQSTAKKAISVLFYDNVMDDLVIDTIMLFATILLDYNMD